MAGYNPTVIEPKWQRFWLDRRTFAAGGDTSRPKYYALDMFPYPSGEGLHVGHPEGYTASDIVARYKRAKGFNVLHPMGWDAFGLPAEQYAIKTNTHPRATTEKNIARFRRQLQAIGFSYDWDREVNTTDPAYYKWTQWIFLKLFDTWFDETRQRGRPIAELVEEFRNAKREVRSAKGEVCRWEELSPTEKRTVLAGYRLAYQAEVAVNWCPGLGTVLANEEVIDGKSEVGGFPVERRPMKQWMLRITAYSERLLAGLDGLHWSDSLKEMQRNWIGRSEGAEVDFEIERGEGGGGKVTVFTTRPDTLFGATYMVLAPEHPLVNVGRAGSIVPAAWPVGTLPAWVNGQMTKTPGEAVADYQKWTAGRSERERQEDTSKTGVFTGAYAINPVNGVRIPIFIADYVLTGYGTGAIMAVPAHDERDFEFAQKFKLPVQRVVAGAKAGRDELPFVEEGVAVNSPAIEGLPTAEAKAKMTAIVQEKSLGRRQVNYKIRDWLFSRQRYWGEPFPLVHLNDGTTVPVDGRELPVRLPELEDFRPTGTIDPPLSKATTWLNVNVRLNGDGTASTVDCGSEHCVPGRRELNTMPQWAGSCWYYLRYLDPADRDVFVSPALEQYWMRGPAGSGADAGGVDLYIGGVEHAVLHLLYSRFWHKVLFDRGLVSTDEPFKKLVNQGLILGEAEYTAFRTEDGTLVSYEFVTPEFENRTNASGVIELVSKHKQTGEVLIGEARRAAEVEKNGDHFILKAHPAVRVDARSFKMSKSRGNVVNPDDVIREYGADSLRLFEMFMGPLEQVKPWSTAGVEGVYRFLQRVWRNLIDVEREDEAKAVKVVTRAGAGAFAGVDGALTADEGKQAEADYQAILRPLHRTIKKVGEDIERLSFNTAISAMMEFNNALAKLTYVPAEAAVGLLRLLEPFAPHVAEELYQRVARPAEEASISQLPWPAFDAALTVDAVIDLPVQVNGKLRARVMVPHDATEDAVIAAAMSDAVLRQHLAGKRPRKAIYVKGRMLNLVL